MPASPADETLVPARIPRRASFRFSLRSLFALLSLAAVASWAVSWQQIHRDEAAFVICWLGGLIAGVGLGRWRRRSGIVEGTLGGSSGCLVAAVACEFRYFPRWLDFAEYLALGIPTGLVLGGATACALWYLIDAPLHGRVLIWSRISLGTLISLCLLGALTWGVVGWGQWSPRCELPNSEVYESNYRVRAIRAFSPSGRFLVVQWEDYHQAKMEIEFYQLGNRRFTRLAKPILPQEAISIEFAPDETWLAMLADGQLQVVDLQGRLLQVEAAGSEGYRIDRDSLLTVSRDGQKIFACWTPRRYTPETATRQEWQTFSSSKPLKHYTQYIDFQGLLFVSPSGKWLVKLHHDKHHYGWIDWTKPLRAEVVRAADLQVVREHVLETSLTIPQDHEVNEFQRLQRVINEMFPDSKIQLLCEGRQMSIRGFARDAEESAQIVALVRSQVLQPNAPTTAKSLQTANTAPKSVINLLEDLNYFERPLFDPDETLVAFDRRVVSLGEPFGDQTVKTMPGKVVGLLPQRRALIVVEEEPVYRTRIPFLRDWFPVQNFSYLCVVDIATGDVLRKSKRLRWIGESRLSQNCRVAVTSDDHNTLQIWDIPQFD